jgi:hypothetical protein
LSLVRLWLFGFGFFCGSSFGFGVVRLYVDCVFIGFRRFFAVFRGFRCLVSVFRLFIFFRRFIVVVVAAAAVARVTAATTAATFRAENIIENKNTF